MRELEQRLWDRMRRALGRRMRLERIENLVNVGTPDVLALAKGFVTPIELKAVAAFPARHSTRVLGARGLSVAQRNWHKSWLDEGGESLILIGVGSREFFAIPGVFADEVNEMDADRLAIFSVASDWDELFVQLGGAAEDV